MNIRNLGLNKYVVVAISIAILAVVFLCPFALSDTSSGMLNQSHSGSDNMPLTHSLHLQEMTLVSVGTTSLTNASSLLSIFLLVTILFLLLRTAVFDLPGSASFFNHYIRRRDYLYQAKQTIHYWLSLFERAPNSIKAA